MPQNTIIACKDLGETPLECLEKVRISHTIGSDVPMTYAGRLDPLASGLMIILVGEECKKKDQYLGLDKTYEFEILVGFETDTYDLLGKIAASPNGKISGPRVGSPDREILPSGFAAAIQSFVCTFKQKYPSFSSKTVGGKQLFQLSKDDELPDEMPEHEVTITRLEQISTRIISKSDLQSDIERRINLVHGDFRQTEIIKLWQLAFKNSTEEEYQIIKCVLDCSSGTYVRQLVADLGTKLGIPLVTYSIERTRIGEYAEQRK